MENAIEHLLGLNLEDHTLLWYQMGIRAFLIFFVTLIFIRMAGIRAFGKKSSFDVVLSIILGAVLSKAIIGASPLFGTIFATFVFVVLHRVMGYLTFYNRLIEKLVKGTPDLLVKDGKINKENMKKSTITEQDLQEALHEKANIKDLSQVDEAWYECTGAVSIVKKKD